MTADSNAFATVQQIPGLTPGEQQYLLTVARGEGFYGLGWGSLPAPGSLIEAQTKALGLVGNEGVGSNNWGAVQGTGSAGSFPHLDHHADGSPYKGTFKKYASPVDGASDVARVLLKPNVRAAIAAGSLHDAVYAQHANGYFELAPDKYLAAVQKNYDILSQSLGWSRLLTPAPSNPAPPGSIIANHPLASGSPLSPSEDSSSISHSTLRYGSVGNEVVEWQRLLASHGFTLTADGDFGRQTLSQTMTFQSNVGLTSDGIVGPVTWSAALNG